MQNIVDQTAKERPREQAAIILPWIAMANSAVYTLTAGCYSFVAYKAFFLTEAAVSSQDCSVVCCMPFLRISLVLGFFM